MTAQPTKLAERLAALASIDIAAVKTSGNVTARDVAALLPQPVNVVTFATPRATAALPGTRNERLAIAKRETPHFYQTIEVLLDGLAAFASTMGADAQISTLDIMVLAIARLLRRWPALNAAWQDDGMLLYDRIDIALSQGSRTVVIADADRKGLRGIAQAIAAGEEATSTFAIVDFTSTGLREASAIVDPHHAGVIALGAPQDRVVATDGAFVTQSCCRLTLSADHRVIDGAAAAEFLSDLKRVLEDPISLLL